MTNAAVSVSKLEKRYRLYKERNDSLEATVTKRRRARYEDFAVIKNISFEIPKGSSLGIIGSNGSGKSTLLKLLAQIISPDSGEIVVNGKLVALLELGAGFHPELTGRENIYLNAAILGMRQKEIEECIDDIISFSELEEFIDVAIKHYSSGMTVRLGFSIAVHVNPDILIIDEVLSVGDESFQQKSLNKIQEFKSNGKTIIIVSHALGTIQEICDQVLWLDHGSIVEVGPPEVIIERYVDDQHRSAKFAEHSEFDNSIKKVIKHVSITDYHENHSGVFQTGSALIFTLILDSKFEPDQIYVVICIKNDNGQIVWQNHESSMVIDKKLVSEDEIVVRCELPSFPVREGIFHLLFRVFDASTGQLIDEWGNKSNFNIVRGDTLDFGFLLVDPDWSNSLVRLNHKTF